jgi:hypothetical protein
MERRVAQLRRMYAIGLGRKPSVVESAEMYRAALMTARAEAALVDPVASHEDVVRLDNAAARARSSMRRIIGAKPAKPSAPAAPARYGFPHEATP